MDKRAINIAFKDIEAEYKKYIERYGYEDTKEEFMKYLINHGLLKQTQLKRYFVISFMNKNQVNNISITETVKTIASEYDIHENTCWDIRKNHGSDFRPQKIIS